MQRNVYGEAFVIIMAIAIIVDLLLVGLGLSSISWRTWMATQHHPTLIAAGTLATVGICYLIRYSWKYVMFMGIMGGHLFVHW
jgi:hypothetical protein